MLALSILTPKGSFLEESVEAVILPGVQGELSILPKHIPLLSALRDGTLSYRKGNNYERVLVGPGYVEVDANGTVVVLVKEATALAKSHH